MYMPLIDQVIFLQPVVILLVPFDVNYSRGFTARSFPLLKLLSMYDPISSATSWKGGNHMILCESNPSASHFSDFAL